MATVGSLFAGIGGFDLGFERQGYDIRWQVENDEYCQRVLQKHWPLVERFHDVCDCGAWNLPRVDVITGGFPCQDVSDAGERAGIDGDRSGLWREMCRIIGELRPQFALVENVPGLFVRGLDRVLGDLAEIGYDAEWQVISAADVGAPHLRKRVWIVAHPGGVGCRGTGPDARRQTRNATEGSRGQEIPSMADSVFAGSQGHPGVECDGDQPGRLFSHSTRPFADAGIRQREEWWEAEPDVGRVAHGVPNRVDRLKGLGNAIVPQIAEYFALMLEPRLVKEYA